MRIIGLVVCSHCLKLLQAAESCEHEVNSTILKNFKYSSPEKSETVCATPSHQEDCVQQILQSKKENSEYVCQKAVLALRWRVAQTQTHFKPMGMPMVIKIKQMLHEKVCFCEFSNDGEGGKR